MRDTVALEGRSVVDHSSPVPYYYQLITYVEQKVKAEEWRPGQLLPSEQEICDSAGVSRTVVRQALAELERKGLVSKHNGKRSSIAYPKYEGRLMQSLRGFYEDAVAGGQKPASRVLDMKVVPAGKEVAEALRLKPGSPVILLNRLRCLDNEPEVLVVTYLPENRCPSLVDEDLSSQSLYELLESKYSLRITQGFRTIEAIALDKPDARLLHVSPGSPALLLKSIGLLSDGTPLEYFVAKHRGDRAKFQVRLVQD
jgi:GntR family transcriptional regulator